MMRYFVVMGIMCLVGTAGLAQDTLQKKIYIANSFPEGAIQLDGRELEAVWKQLPRGSGFIQSEPYEKSPPSFPTYFKVGYDQKYLYVFIRAYDAEPDQIVRRVARRDDGDNADMVGVILDTYHDQRTAFAFMVNAAGVRNDEVYSEGGMRQDDSWDPVWEAAVAVDDSGWSAELKIPFSQLRFAKREEQVWGFNVYRLIYRKQEVDLWNFVPKDAAQPVAYLGMLRGIRGIYPSHRIELLPYAVGSRETFLKEPGNPFRTGERYATNIGLDGKIGITSDMNLDITINPDFGQIEADPSVVNLTEFETFYQEKRPFFIEGNDILSYSLAIGEGVMGREGLFYSRRIGRTPHYYPDLRNGEYADVPRSTSILGALKLTGKTPKGLSVGVLEAVTAPEWAEIDSAGKRRRVMVEPLTNYFLGRVRQDFQKGNIIVGGIFTATNRRITEPHLRFLNKRAYTGGLDFTRFWQNKTLMLDVKTAFSHIAGDPQAILLAQTSSAHYFQRPDAHHVQLDSNRTTLNGHGGAISFGKVGGGHISAVGGVIWRSPGLELNDLGYLRRADQLVQFVWLGYREWVPRWIFRQLNVNVSWNNLWDFSGEKLGWSANVGTWMQFMNFWNVGGGIFYSAAGYSPTKLRGGPMYRTSPDIGQFFHFGTDSRKDIRVGGNFSSGKNLEGRTFWTSAGVYLRMRMGSKFSFSIRPSFRKQHYDQQYVMQTRFNGQARYILATIDQQTLGVTIRLNYSVTPNLSIQYYGQPFVSAGKYSEFKYVANPRAVHLAERLHWYTEGQIRQDTNGSGYWIDEDEDGTDDYWIYNPDFNFRQFRSNLVIRWEYVPGSTVFLVWTQERTGWLADGSLNIKNNFRELFDVFPDNIFLIKLNYWFSL